MSSSMQTMHKAMKTKQAIKTLDKLVFYADYVDVQVGRRLCVSGLCRIDWLLMNHIMIVFIVNDIIKRTMYMMHIHTYMVYIMPYGLSLLSL